MSTVLNLAFSIAVADIVKGANGTFTGSIIAGMLVGLSLTVLERMHSASRETMFMAHPTRMDPG